LQLTKRFWRPLGSVMFRLLTNNREYTMSIDIDATWWSVTLLCLIILLLGYTQVIAKSISLLTPADVVKLLKFFVLQIQSRYEAFHQFST